MKILSFLIVFTFSQKIFTQNDVSYLINNMKLDSIKSEYMQIVGNAKFLSTKLNIVIDYGQWNGWKQEYKLTDHLGKKIELTTMIDALNFMVKNGFEFVDSFVSTENGSSTYHYIIKRKDR